MQNEDALFRKATLRICGNLEIDQSLHELLLFLQEVMPVAKIFLRHYDDEYQAMRTIDYSSGAEYGKLDLLTPPTEAARENKRSRRCYCASWD